MATESPVPVLAQPRSGTEQLASEWRRLTRVATVVAVLTAPLAFEWLHQVRGWGIGWSLVGTFFEMIAFRGLVDVILRRFIPWPSLFGAAEELREEDVTARRRVWFWRRWVARAMWLVVLGIVIFLINELLKVALGSDWLQSALGPQPGATFMQLILQMPLLLVANFLIFFGPFLLMAGSQIRSYEPGDADWGVKLEDVRGQAEAKEEVRRVVTLWQSGEAFERAGGKRERGLLMLGAPGTGKTMLSKAIATGFNCPFVSIPGSGFAGMFLGMDAITVRLLARRAKKLAAKWGGQCIVFIDEIDAVGQRRSSLGTGGFMTGGEAPVTMEELCFYGPHGALTPTGDLVLETRAWRERMFAHRAAATHEGRSAVGGIVNRIFPGGGGMFGGGQLALNQLLVVMDGIGEPRFLGKTFTRFVNTFLDATYVIPARIGRLRLRLPKPRPAGEQIYFIGACNAPLESLDPALIRPGRMGRHVWFRTPTKDDRKDIFDLYLSKVSHDDDLDSPKRRDELSRITNGYSPAMVEQVCSMALTIAHYDGRIAFAWDDIVEAMTTVESGTAVNVEYIPEETRAVAIHEAGHAVAGHVYMKGVESTRLSIRKRGASLGHHQALEKEERFSSWRHEEVGRLIWTLGAMAAERVFYGENSTGVGGDVQHATTRAAWMVGSCAMGPEPVVVNGNAESDEERALGREKILKRFEEIGLQIMRRAGSGGPFEADPIAGVLSDRDKRQTAAQLLGQAYMAAHVLILANRASVERVAEMLIERREMHGDEVVELLDSLELTIPETDLLEEAVWPQV
ncbi:MAG TPA: AAA family ATPase [Gaiellales bacterium]|jgi:ATP-dependent Zn protease|nr:AAA family ATPase [Gaiellales bacterium]